LTESCRLRRITRSLIKFSDMGVHLMFAPSSSYRRRRFAPSLRWPLPKLGKWWSWRGEQAQVEWRSHECVKRDSPIRNRDDLFAQPRVPVFPTCQSINVETKLTRGMAQASPCKYHQRPKTIRKSGDGQKLPQLTTLSPMPKTSPGSRNHQASNIRMAWEDRTFLTTIPPRLWARNTRGRLLACFQVNRRENEVSKVME